METIIVVNPNTKIKEVLDVVESFSEKDIGDSYAQGWNDAIAEVLKEISKGIKYHNNCIRSQEHLNKMGALFDLEATVSHLRNIHD